MQGWQLLSKHSALRIHSHIYTRGLLPPEDPSMKLRRATQHTHLDPLNCTLHRPVTWSTSVTLPSLMRRVPFMALRTATPSMSSAGKCPLLRHKLLLWHSMVQEFAFHNLGMVGNHAICLADNESCCQVHIKCQKCQASTTSRQLRQGSLSHGTPTCQALRGG